MSRSVYLTTFDLHKLDLIVAPLRRYDGSIYLVGSVLEKPDWRDVDIRMILEDDDFDNDFGNELLWETFCYAVTAWLRAETGLPIDFQVQRQTEANTNHKGIRNALSGGHRSYAGYGDGTPYVKLESKGS